MTRKTAFILFGFLLPFVVLADFDPETSVVEIEVTKKSYDYRTPWVVRNEQVSKNGIVIGPNQILTTADGLSGQYLSRIKKGGISRQYTADLQWVDYYANVAIFDVADEEFWQGMEPVELSRTIPQGGELQIYRWRGGRIEERAAEIIRLFSGQSKTSYIRHLILTASSPIESAGWAEIVVDGDDLVGLTASASKDTLAILPAGFIAMVLERREASADFRLGYFDFKSMSANNPALLASKGLDLRDVGVVVTEVGGRGLSSDDLQPGDVILEIDGFEIDSEGTYLDPEYGRLSMSGLATRRHVAGEVLPFRIWREGRERMIDYTLPGADFDKELIPEQRYDAAAQYLVAGGFVFQPLNGPLMNALGKNRPPLLDYYRRQTGADSRAGFVVLSGVLPDDFNLGYEDLRYLLVDKINGQPINDLADIEAALKRPEGGFHRIQFMQEERVQHVVLNARDMEGATMRILKNYRIPARSQL